MRSEKQPTITITITADERDVIVNALSLVDGIAGTELFRLCDKPKSDLASVFKRLMLTDVKPAEEDEQ